MDPIHWLRTGIRTNSNASTIWNSLIKSLPIISKNSSWQVGRGIQMFLGIDPICGLGETSLLSLELVKELHRRNLYVLKDIQQMTGSFKWVNSLAMGLTGRIAEEWDMYILAPNQGSVSLSEDPDKLVWVYNSREEQVIAKLAYCAAISEHSMFEDK